MFCDPETAMFPEAQPSILFPSRPVNKCQILSTIQINEAFLKSNYAQ